MAGDNDRIYSYNPVYRDVDGMNFYSFDRRNAQFNNRQVLILGGGDPAMDHQGHIVPQNILNLILDDAMQDMAENCHDLEETVQYINDQGPQWMRDAYTYGVQLGVPMFDFEYDDPEARFGGLFSIVTWNPVNLCRAPSDDRRGGAPGNNIDQLVVNYLAVHQVAQGVDLAWFASLNNLIAAPNNLGLITAYLNACSATLAGQLHAGIGYYAFPWEYQVAVQLGEESKEELKEDSGILVPSKK